MKAAMGILKSGGATVNALLSMGAREVKNTESFARRFSEQVHGVIPEGRAMQSLSPRKETYEPAMERGTKGGTASGDRRKLEPQVDPQASGSEWIRDRVMSEKAFALVNAVTTRKTDTKLRVEKSAVRHKGAEVDADGEIGKKKFLREEGIECKDHGNNSKDELNSQSSDMTVPLAEASAMRSSPHVGVAVTHGNHDKSELKKDSLKEIGFDGTNGQFRDDAANVHGAHADSATHVAKDPKRGEMSGGSQDAVASPEREETSQQRIGAAIVRQIGQSVPAASITQIPAISTSVRSSDPRLAGIAEPVGQHFQASPSGSALIKNDHQVLKATPTTLEVGIAAGPHGWLKVRAEMANDGQVSALLSSSSRPGQQMLNRELNSLNTFLRNEDIRIGSLTVHATTPATDRSDLRGGSGNGLDREHQQGNEQGRNEHTTNTGSAIDESSGALDEGAVITDWWSLPSIHLHSEAFVNVMA